MTDVLYGTSISVYPFAGVLYKSIRKTRMQAKSLAQNISEALNKKSESIFLEISGIRPMMV